MNQKVLIKEILKSWYFIDSVLLNGHAKKAITEQKDYDEYISIKAALLSNLYELYNYIQYDPKDIIMPKNDKILQESAVQTAKKSKSISANMIQDKKFVNSIKKVVIKESQNCKNCDIKILSENIINTRFLKMSLDNILIGMPLIESKNPIKDFKTEILEETYLTMRSNLIEISKKYNKEFFKKKIIKEAFEGLISFLGFKLSLANAKALELLSNTCQKKCASLPDPYQKKICFLECKIQLHQKVIVSLRRYAAQTNNEAAREKFAKDVKKAQMKVSNYQRQLVQLKAKMPIKPETKFSV